MPVTRYYPTNGPTTRGADEPSTEQSAVLPNGSSGPSGAYIASPTFPALGLSKGAPGTAQNRPNWSTLGQTARQSTFILHAWYRLGVQTIPSGTWSFVAAVLGTNASANTFWAASVYVWRPSTSSVVGYIYDATTELGAEWGTTTSSRIASFTGNSISTFNGDTLIFEMWSTAAQANTTSYNNRIFFDASTGSSDFTADGQTDLSSWIDAPDTLVPYDSNQPIGPGTSPNQISINQTGLGSAFSISQQQIGSLVTGI